MATQQALIVNAPFYDPFLSAPSPGYSTVAEGTVSEDLFFYPARNLSLKKNETAYLPLFTAEMPYSHLYTWKIEDYLDELGRYRSRNEREGEKLAEEVWHSCRLENSLKMPLTTASAEFVKEGRFVGQDVCYYTAPGARTTIRINRAMNILAEQAEFEVEREQNAATFHGHRYDLVKVRGELRLRSRLDREVRVEITKELSGEVAGTAPEAKAIKTAKGLKQVNPKHRLVWNIDLDSGQASELTYSYQVYVRY